MAGRGPVVIAGGGRIDVSAGVVGAGVQIAVDLEHVGLRGGFEQIAAVVVNEELPRARKSARDPLRVARTTDLFIARGGRCPVLVDGRRIALAVARRIPEAINEVAIRAGRERDA